MRRKHDLKFDRLEGRQLLATFQDNLLNLGMIPNIVKPGGTTEDYYALVGSTQDVSIDTNYIPGPYSTISKIELTFSGPDILDDSLTIVQKFMGDFVIDTDQEKEWNYNPKVSKNQVVNFDFHNSKDEGLMTMRVEVTAHYMMTSQIFYDEIIFDLEAPEVDVFQVDYNTAGSVVFEALDLNPKFTKVYYVGTVDNDTHFKVRVGFMQTLNFDASVDRLSEGVQTYGDDGDEHNDLMDDPVDVNDDYAEFFFENVDGVNAYWTIASLTNNVSLVGTGNTKPHDQPQYPMHYDDSTGRDLDSFSIEMNFTSYISVWGGKWGPSDSYIIPAIPVALAKANWNTGWVGTRNAGGGAINTAAGWNLFDTSTTTADVNGTIGNTFLNEWNGHAQSDMITIYGTDVNFVIPEEFRAEKPSKKLLNKIFSANRHNKYYNTFILDEFYNKKKDKTLRFQYN